MSTPGEKICPEQDLHSRLSALPRPLVMTNGVFDVLHRGHVDYLSRAAALGASLVVAVNTDRSARMLGKGPDRPLNRDIDRAFVLAGLASVSLVTFFDTPTPLDLIGNVRPDIYVKGGDYDMETLQETQLVRSWGGQSVAITFVDGFSTTRLVQRIRNPLRKAVFLDRDGVINLDRAYVHRWEDFEFVPGIVDAMRQLKQAGYLLVVVTNQSGIARGYYSEAQYQQLTAQMRKALENAGADVDAVYHCPHHPEGSVATYAIDCDCRKPAPGMILQAARELGIDLASSWLIGDKPSDIDAGKAAGVGRTCLVASDNPQSVAARAASQQVSLTACIDHILQAQPV